MRASTGLSKHEDRHQHRGFAGQEGRCKGIACTRDGGSTAFAGQFVAAAPPVLCTIELIGPAGGIPAAIVGLWLSTKTRVTVVFLTLAVLG